MTRAEQISILTLGGVYRQLGARGRGLLAPDGQEVAALVGGLVVELEARVRLRVGRRRVVLQHFADGNDLLLVFHGGSHCNVHQRCDHSVRDRIRVVFWFSTGTLQVDLASLLVAAEGLVGRVAWVVIQ